MIKNNCTFVFERDPASSDVTVRISGEIDHHAAAGLRREVDAGLLASVPDHLFLDMSGVTFMDSSGLGFIMGRYELMRRFSGETVLLSPSAPVEKMLKLTGFENRITILKSKNGSGIKGQTGNMSFS